MTFVLGVGTGRCGTNSLADLLDVQPEAHVTHERFRAEVPWGYEGNAWLQRLLNAYPADGSLYGDVALYWLPQVEPLLEEGPEIDVRVVALRRGKRDTVESYRRYTENRNHWQVHDGKRYDMCPRGWDQCYPKFQAVDKKEALGMYWSYYYGEVARLERKYPERVRCFKMEMLNSPEGQRAILRFVGRQGRQQRLLKEIHQNRGHQPAPLHRRVIGRVKRVAGFMS